jgi:diacylglycerol kinase family enzyme
MLDDVEEVLRAQMPVPGLIAGVQAFGIDRQVDSRDASLRCVPVAWTLARVTANPLPRAAGLLPPRLRTSSDRVAVGPHRRESHQAMSPSERLAHYGWRAVDPARRPVLFVNPTSGGGKAARADVAQRARDRGIEAVVLRPRQGLAALVSEAVANDADLLGAAGGDGSLAIVAAAARLQGLPFVCVPAGTRNHFAKDVGVDPHDLVGSLDAMVDGVERWIDVAEVNGRLFLNNVSLGIYGDAVRQEQYRNEKARTLFETARAVLGPSASLPELQLVDDLGREHRSPAVVLVSNNPYALDRPLVAGTRRTLDSGELGIVVLDAPATRPLAGRAWSATSFEVAGHAPLHAGVDGEAADLSPPLRFAIRPAALRVRISSRHPGVSPSGLLP